MCSSPIIVKNEKYLGPWQERLYKIPCGKCEECLKKMQNDWFVRAKLQLQDSLCAFFVTLTYNDFFVPQDEIFSVPILCKKDLKDFFKRLRHHFCFYQVLGDRKKKCFLPLKYLACGEYGGRTGRPHYHFILFIPKGYIDDQYSADFIDYVRKAVFDSWSREASGPDGQKVYDYSGQEMRQPFGNIVVDHCTDYRIRYVVKYVLKSIVSDGESVVPSFRLVSKGLGLSAFDTDIQDLDHLCFADDGGYTFGLPRYLREKVFAQNERLKILFKIREAKRIEALSDYHDRIKSASGSKLRNQSKKNQL